MSDVISRRALASIVIEDGTTPTAQTVTITGEFTITTANGEADVTPIRDATGAFTGEAIRGQEQPSTITIAGLQRGFATATTIGNLKTIDAAMRTDDFLSVMVATNAVGATCQSSEKLYTIKITENDCDTGGTTVEAWAYCTWTGQVERTHEGNQVTLNIQSFVPHPTMTAVP